MSGKFKNCSNISLRHKGRRFEENVANRQVQQDFENSDYGEDELSEENLNDNSVQVAPEVESSEDDYEAVSSHEEDNVDNFEDAEIGLRVRNQINDSSEDEVEDNDNIENIEFLRKKALKNAFLAANINHTQGNVLLSTLRQFPFNLIHLPKDSRTVFNTPTITGSTRVQKLAGGEYLHIGFKKTLIKKLNNIHIDFLPDPVSIDFSTDGARVYKGVREFWPHQYRIVNIADKRPIIAGLFEGNGKPSNVFEFFEQFVQEIAEVLREGIVIKGRRLSLTLRCFIADCPARAFCLNHWGHTSSKACSKCKVEGDRCSVAGFERTMVFLGVDHVLRTDEEYENLVDDDHHKGGSPLSPLLPLAKKVPFDPMHLVYLGNVKKIFEANVDGKFGCHRLNRRKLDILNSRMIQLQRNCPSEFNRRPQEFTKFHGFKATEYRQFLLYTATAVLKNVFDEDKYRHLMILHFVMRLLTSEDTPPDLFPFCKDASKLYVTLCQQLYGEQFMSYNIHGFLHIVEDVITLGAADTFSAFCYENNLTQLRKWIRKPHLWLPQVYKRISESEDADLPPADTNIRINLTQIHVEGPLPNNIPANLCQQFKKMVIGEFTLSTDLRDRCCLSENEDICVIKNIIRMEEQVYFIVNCFQSITDVYDVGITSSSVGVYSCENLQNHLRTIPLRNIKNKMYMMPQCSDVESQEEMTVENRWICAKQLSPLQFPADF